MPTLTHRMATCIRCTTLAAIVATLVPVWTAPADIRVEGAQERALIHRGGEQIQWKVVAL